MEQDDSIWSQLPYTVLFQIFQYLDYKELIRVGEVCQYWYQVSRDEFLWKRLLYYYFNVDSSIFVTPGESWLDEFQRLCYHTPIVQTETLTDHINQVLHVSFSHNGLYFATCSKDGYVLLYNSEFPASVIHYTDMRMYSWKYAQFSQFNESDTLLLVSGIHSTKIHSTSGVIAVFNLEEGFHLQCHVINKPYDVFGTWYTDQMLLSGDLHWLAHLVSVSHLWINKASQEADSERVPVTQIMFRFFNRNASSIKSIMIGNCLRDEELDSDNSEEEGGEADGEYRHFCHNAACCNEKIEKHFFTPDNTIYYTNDYRQAEKDEMLSSSSTIENHIGTINGRDALQNDKYLIFTTGTSTFVPHQIGLKRIKPFNFPESIDMGLSLKERLLLRRQQKQQMRSQRANSPPEPDWQDYETVAEICDKVDHLIDLRGHIVGMALSPDHRYLYVNNRPWPPDFTITNPLSPPPITQDTAIAVVDLVTLKVVGSMLHKQKTYTSNDEAFFIFLDVSDKYVASGAEDKSGYLWDRHYGVCLAKFPHTDVVNAIAFNPKDPEMVVTASDDNTIKVWRSRAQIKELQLQEEEFQKAVVFRKDCEKLNYTRRYRNV